MKSQPTIQNFTNIQIREAVSDILSNQNTSGALAPLIEKQNLWQQSDFAKLFRWDRARRIRDTANFFYEYFKTSHNLDVPALRSDAAFAENMISHSNSGNIAACQKDMQLYCEYIALLSTKPRETQKTYFESFPPKTASDVACPGGTGARLEELIQNLKVPKEDRPILEIHQLLVSKLIDRLKYHVPEAHQIHLLPYLNFAFGVESKTEVEKRDITFVTPQFDIPAHVLQHSLSSYAENFGTEIQRRFDYLKKEITAICEEFDANLFFDTSNADKLSEMTRKFQALGIPVAELGALIQEKEEEETKSTEEKSQDSAMAEDSYEWNLAAVDTRIKKDLTSRLTSNNLEKSYIPSQATLEDVAQESDLFKEDAGAKIAALLKSPNDEDLLIGVESLWTLSIRLAGNSPIQTIKTIKQLPTNFLLEVVKPRLPDSQKFKIENILDNYESYCTDPRINAYFSDAFTLKDLLYGNAPHEDLEHYFEDNSEGAFEKRNREIDQLEDAEFRQLMSRPDRKEILQKISDNNILLPENVIAKLLEIAAKHNEIDICRDHLLQLTEETNPRLFTSGAALISAIKNSNSEMVQLFLEKGAKPCLQTFDEKGLYPIHHAAMVGESEMIILLKEAGSSVNISNLRFGVPTPAHIAANFGKIPALRALKDNGAYIDHRLITLMDKEIRPIHAAIMNRQSDAVIALVDLGARITIAEDDAFMEFMASEPRLLPLISKHNLPEAFEKCFTELRKMEIDQIHLSDLLKLPNRFENVQKSLDRSAEIAAEKNYPEMLTCALKFGAKTPAFYRGSDEEIIDIIKNNAPFNKLSRAITTSITQNLPRLSMNGAKELLTIEREIRAALIRTYEGNAEQMLQDFNLTEADHVRSCFPFGQKYKITPKILEIGSATASLIEHKYSTQLPISYSDIFISKSNRQSILDQFKSREIIQNITPQTAPQPTVYQNLETQTAKQHSNRSL